MSLTTRNQAQNPEAARTNPERDQVGVAGASPFKSIHASYRISKR